MHPLSKLLEHVLGGVTACHIHVLIVLLNICCRTCMRN